MLQSLPGSTSVEAGRAVPPDPDKMSCSKKVMLNYFQRYGRYCTAGPRRHGGGSGGGPASPVAPAPGGGGLLLT
uniref:RFX-type winged-helix domain-containing protein n=1 Tax=Macrostomum lignano TaxID=282301 RepID=A0A1I8FLF5_9PLAT